MYTLKEQYKKQLLLKKLSETVIITENIDNILIETFEQQEVEQLNVALDYMLALANDFNLDSLKTAVAKATKVVFTSSGMMGNVDKWKANLAPWAEDISDVVSFIGSFISFTKNIKSILSTINKMAPLTDEAKAQPLGGMWSKEQQDAFNIAIKESFKAPGIFGFLGKKSPYLDPVLFAVDLVHENSFNDLYGTIDSQIPDNTGVNEKDAENLAGAAQGNKEDANDLAGTENDDKLSTRIATAGKLSDELDVDSDDVLKVLQRLSDDGKLKEQNLHDPIGLFKN